MGPDRCSRRCVLLAGHLVATVIADGAPPLACPGVVIVETGAETEFRDSRMSSISRRASHSCFHAHQSHRDTSGESAQQDPGRTIHRLGARHVDLEGPANRPSHRIGHVHSGRRAGDLVSFPVFGGLGTATATFALRVGKHRPLNVA
jgi:hypothetical protein